MKRFLIFLCSIPGLAFGDGVIGGGSVTATQIQNALSGNPLEISAPPSTSPVFQVQFSGMAYPLLSVWSPTGSFGDGGCSETAEFDIPDQNHYFQTTSCGNMIVASSDPLYLQGGTASYPGTQAYLGDGMGYGNSTYVEVDDGGRQVTITGDTVINSTLTVDGGIQDSGGNSYLTAAVAQFNTLAAATNSFQPTNAALSKLAANNASALTNFVFNAGFQAPQTATAATFNWSLIPPYSSTKTNYWVCAWTNGCLVALYSNTPTTLAIKQLAP